MKIIKLVSLAFILVACSDDSNNQQSVSIWNDDSERIVIVQDKGNTPNSDDRYTTYDYSRDTLTANAKDALPKILSITEPLTCAEDGVTYDVTITSGSGEESTYFSSNMACGDTEGLYFVLVEDIDSLIPLLFNY